MINLFKKQYKVQCAFFDSKWNLKEQGKYKVERDMVTLFNNCVMEKYIIIQGKQLDHVVTDNGRIIYFKEPTYVFKENDPIPLPKESYPVVMIP